jgi:endonuclease/exonuclease/phosphatase family metal-dependent hydrolase
MWVKILLGVLCVLMIAGAVRFPAWRQRTLLATKATDGPHLRIMTWNVGYAELEPDTRAHTKDLKAIADEILKHDPDAVALQELAGPEQLKILLALLGGKYVGSTAPLINTDRVEAVLTKDHSTKFESFSAGGQYAESAAFHPVQNSTEVVLVSAHANAFSAANRRTYTGDIVDWTVGHASNADVFVAGDFNFEVTSTDQSNLYTDNLKNDSEAYSYLLKYFRDLGRDAGDTAINDRRIDYVFGPDEKVLIRQAEVLRTSAVGRMDHWPIVVEVAL